MSPSDPHTLSIEQALRYRDKLPGETAALDCELLLRHVLGVNSAYLRTWPDKNLSPDDQAHFLSLVSARESGQPIAHLIGAQAFWTLNLRVSPDTLIPRQDTELLVECALECLLPEQATVLDLGTGTGAIALALASERPDWAVTGADFKPEIVALAELNARDNQIGNASFVCSHWFTAFADQRFDLIVSNPPYIDAEDPHLEQGDLRFEAKTALVADDAGYADISEIVQHAHEFLNPGGVLMFEHGYEQGEGVRKLLMAQGYREVSTYRDLAGLDRVTVGYVSETVEEC